MRRLIALIALIALAVLLSACSGAKLASLRSQLATAAKHQAKTETALGARILESEENAATMLEYKTSEISQVEEQLRITTNELRAAEGAPFAADPPPPRVITRTVYRDVPNDTGISQTRYDAIHQKAGLAAVALEEARRVRIDLKQEIARLGAAATREAAKYILSPLERYGPGVTALIGLIVVQIKKRLSSWTS